MKKKNIFVKSFDKPRWFLRLIFGKENTIIFVKKPLF